MGEFSLSGNANIGLSGVEISVNSTAGSNPNTIFYTTPTSEAAATAGLHQGQPRVSQAMQDELSEKPQSAEDLGVTEKPKECCDGNSNADLNLTSTVDKLPEHVTQQGAKSAAVAAAAGIQLFHGPGDPNPPTPTPTANPAGAGPGPGPLLPTAVDKDSYVHNLNGGLGFQNFTTQQQQPPPPQPQPQPPQLFGNHNQNQGRRAITAAHNFPHNVVRQQSSHPLFKNYGSWTSPGQGSWSGGSAWNRGRSVPNLTPLQQIGVGNRKPSPTFNHQQPQAISPVKFRRSTSYPGKGHFQQPPTFEITATDEPRELLSYQVKCKVWYPLHTSPMR